MSASPARRAYLRDTRLPDGHPQQCIRLACQRVRSGPTVPLCEKDAKQYYRGKLDREGNPVGDQETAFTRGQSMGAAAGNELYVKMGATKPIATPYPTKPSARDVPQVAPAAVIVADRPCCEPCAWTISQGRWLLKFIHRGCPEHGALQRAS